MECYLYIIGELNENITLTPKRFQRSGVTKSTFMKYKYYILALIAGLFFCFIEKTNSQNTITVTDCNLAGWVKQPIGKSSLGFVNGPASPPVGNGSLKFYVPAGGIFWPGDFVRFRNGQYSGTRIASLTELSFDTYIEARDTIADINFMVVLSDINGDGTAEHNLVFDPRYQNPNFIRSTMPNQGISHIQEWQHWDALRGGWFYGGDASTDPDHGGPFFTIAEYLSQYPDATIRNDPAKGGPAIRLTAGGVVFKPNYYGSMDNFKIGINGVTTIYDFEFSTSNAGPDKYVNYGYGSNCITLSGSAVGGVAPYTYLWSPGGTNPNSLNTTVCPTTTTNYTLSVTDANGCSRTDQVTVNVNDVRCGSKLDKVKVCHNGEEICIAPQSVEAHLKHGDKLGACLPDLNYTERKNTAEMIADELKHTIYPNPFSNSTVIRYALPEAGKTIIKIYTSEGIEVDIINNGYKVAGSYQFTYNTTKLNKGIYYYKIIVNTGSQIVSSSGKMIKL